uniref:NADH dehydrogenase subunit 6 n=1 Tax=Spinactaletes boneti TaxID=2736147 RepID=UPI001EDD9E09|nr:NADH dehydrogenase subunit 6 [Spinactaletes boneti]UJY98013.1 NADH dehydrogenase subunit 6 [Spinactaletes boneti]
MNYFLILQTLMIAMLTLSLTLTMMSHPVGITIVILTQTFLIATALWMMHLTAWMSFIIFLIMIGGMMVLFSYIVSLASNETFSPLSKKSMITMIVIFMLTVLLMMAIDLTPEINQLIDHNTQNIIYKMYNKNFWMLTMMVMAYLLLSLIVVVKIMESFKGPMRSTMQI